MGRDCLRHLVGLADCCELLARAFAFPTVDLVRAVSDGSFAADAKSCLADAGDTLPSWEAEALDALSQELSGDKLFDELRFAHTKLFLLPGGEALVWPYESGFIQQLASGQAPSALFRSPVQIDVEKHMRGAGVEPISSRTEPSDSLWNEWSFLSFLYGSAAEALFNDDAIALDEWCARVEEFWSEHAVKWFPRSMECVREEASSVEGGLFYAISAAIGLRLCALIEADRGARE